MKGSVLKEQCSVFSRLVFLKLKPNIVIVSQKEQSAQFLPLCSLIIPELI